MKKRLLSLLLALVFVVGFIPVTAQAEGPAVIDQGACGATEADNLTWALTEDGVLTITGTGAMATTWTTDGGAPWFNYRSMITSVVIGEGVTSIGQYAFGRTSNDDAYENLTSVSIPSSVTSIGNAAFRCTGLSGTVTVPATVTSLGGSAFRSTAMEALIVNCDLLASANFAFAENAKLTAVTINGVLGGDGTRTVANLFKDCSTLASITFAGNVTQDGQSTTYGSFQNCNALKNVLVKKSVTQFCGFCLGIKASSGVLTFDYEGSELDWENVTVTKLKFQTVNFLGGSITGLEISGEYKKDYMIGEDFDPTGIVVSAVLSTGEKAEIPAEKVTFTGFDSTALGEVTVTASYKRYENGGIVNPPVTATFTVSVVDFAQLKPVVTASNDKKTGKIKLTIEPVEGAAGYKIYVATAADGEYELAAETDKTSYTYSGKAGTKYYFKVVAVTADGAESAESDPVNKFQLPAQVTKLKAKSAKAKQVTLTWKKITGAKKYFVYMSANGKTGWKKIGTAKTNKFEYKKAAAGKKLYFKVQAVTANGKKGEFSKAVSVKVKK